MNIIDLVSLPFYKSIEPKKQKKNKRLNAPQVRANCVVSLKLKRDGIESEEKK